ncbi:MAG: hypothetical protein ABWY93_10905, partial [Mycobacterium sp.]
YHSQVHHAAADWKNGGHTDIDDLTLACKADNLLVENTAWTTRKNPDGITEWIPPPHLDTGQPRTNNYHHPERLLTPPEDDDDPKCQRSRCAPTVVEAAPTSRPASRCRRQPGRPNRVDCR